MGRRPGRMHTHRLGNVRWLRMGMRAVCLPENKVVGRPGARQLHLALLHRGAGRRKLVHVTIHALAVDQVRDIQSHFSAFGHPAAYLFVQRQEEAMHLKADGACAGLALTSASRIFPQVGQIFPTNPFRGQMLVERVGTTIIDKDLEVHFSLAAQSVNVAEELPLVRPNGFAEGFVVVENSSESEWEDGGVLKAVRNNPGMIYAGLLVQGIRGVVFAYDDREITCRVKKDLVTAYPKDRFHWYRFAMAS